MDLLLQVYSICHYEGDHFVEDDLTLPLSLSGADADYTGVSMMLTIPTGTISAGGNLIPTVMIVTSTDSRVENVETFTLSLNTSDLAVMPQSVSSTVSINDTTSEHIHSHSMVLSMTNMKETANAISRPVADPLVILAVMA